MNNKISRIARDGRMDKIKTFKQAKLSVKVWTMWRRDITPASLRLTASALSSKENVTKTKLCKRSNDEWPAQVRLRLLL